MRKRIPDEVTCAICGRHFDPSESRGWCPNPSCGEWQHPSFPLEGDSGGSDAGGGSGTRSCPNCGNEVPADTNFCTHCATQFDDADVEEDDGDDGELSDCPDCGADLSQIPTEQLSKCPICMFDLSPMAEKAAKDDDADDQAGETSSEPDTDEDGTGDLAECPNCGEDLSPIPKDMRTVCPGCRVDLEESMEAEEARQQAGADEQTASGHAAGGASGPPASGQSADRGTTDPTPAETDSSPLEPDDPVDDVEGIGTGYRQRLSGIGIETVADLLLSEPGDISAETGISTRRITDWVDEIPLDADDIQQAQAEPAQESQQSQQADSTGHSQPGGPDGQDSQPGQQPQQSTDQTSTGSSGHQSQPGQARGDASQSEPTQTGGRPGQSDHAQAGGQSNQSDPAHAGGQPGQSNPSQTGGQSNQSDPAHAGGQPGQSNPAQTGGPQGQGGQRDTARDDGPDYETPAERSRSIDKSSHSQESANEEDEFELGGDEGMETQINPSLDDSMETKIQPNYKELSLDVMGQDIPVTDGSTVGREVRRAMVEAGRSEEKAVYVHRKHIRIDQEDGQYYLTRLGDNGLKVNGSTVEKGNRVPIEDGDDITFSDVVTASVTIR